MHDESPTVFSHDWGRQVHAAINASSRYRDLAALWRGSLGLEMAPAPEGRPFAALLDLEHGTCKGVACGPEARLEEAEFHLRATHADWRELLAGQLEPMWGIMSGRLRLARGNLAALLPFAQAAGVLVEVIASVEAVFPPDEGTDRATG